ncbi:beta-propeller domain-containing protein [Actinomadura xylanilytica]|uniref:beta-propeller domain-containing protein n=1 Tax=Actinomadura xylanilytica TaxID=887459 RepID=UPI00255AAC59|nr:beta-propeller domain-containing protein [Actinomadura xylanilytica]MDL4771700.1 beta-propeller domain-containing protein [Actinomadura xylanilytica]
MRPRILTPLAPAAVLLLAGCSGSGGDAETTAPPMRLVAYDDCDSLLGGLRTATSQRVGPYGLDGATPYGATLDGGMARSKAMAPNAPDAQAAPAEQDAAASHSGTNTHEPDADEPDLVKTDGRRIVALAGRRLQVVDAASRKVTGTLDLPDRTRLGPGGGGNAQLLLSGDRALVLSPENPVMTRGPDDGAMPVPAAPRTRLTLVDLAGTPKVAGTMSTRSTYVDARQTGSVARVVVQSAPQIRFPVPPGGRAPGRAAVERNRETVRDAPLDAWLPTFQVSGPSGTAKTYTVPCEQVSRPASYTGATMLTVLTLDLARGLGDPAPVSVAADGRTVYGTGSSLYITGTPPVPPRPDRPPEVRPVAAERTDVHKFEIRGPGRPRYAASGSVAGSLLNQYSMSEYGGNLRIATTTTPVSAGVRRDLERPAATAAPSPPRSESAVRVLAQHGARLDLAGEIGGLGRGERIYAVRFLGPAAYVVTFRQVDPLYVVDLRNPARPRVSGELKISGYSAYLHPMADGRLLGVGQDAGPSGRVRGTQVSLFDVSAAPRRVGAFKLPGSSAQAEFDPHAFLYWPRTGLTVVPVTRGATGASEALVLKVDGGGVRRLGSVEHPGNDYAGSIRRSLLVGGTLWTFSDAGARATDAASLGQGAWLPFTAG